MTAPSPVVRLESANERLRDRFMYWQCRIRQIAMRTGAGQPSPGMVPSVVVPSSHGPQATGNIVTVLCRRPEHSQTMELQHIVRRTQDPAQRRDDALKLLAERYYQAAREFSTTITATFPPASGLASNLLAYESVQLGFEQYSQRYALRCEVRRLSLNNPLREATFWHNACFNPALPADCEVLGFEPRWAHCEADPPVR